MMKPSPDSIIHRFTLFAFCLAFMAASASPLTFTADLANKPDGDKPAGFKVAPVIGTKDGTRFINGPAVWETAATPGIVSIKFSMLGFESGHQHDLLTIHSDTGKPYGVIRNVNSSGRLNGTNVISGAQNRFTRDGWHAVEITLDTRKGLLGVITDGKSRYQQKTGIENVGFTGISFANTVKLRDFSIVIAPLPAIPPEEQALVKALPELNSQIMALPESTTEQARKKTVLIYQLEKLHKAIEQQSFDIGLDIVADIKDGLTKDMGGKNLDHPWLKPVLQAKDNPFLDPEMNERWYQSFSSTPDYAWNLPTKDVAGYTGLYGKHGAFTEAVNAGEWLMMAVHPQSPLKDRRELLLRAMRRIDAYLEDDFHGR